MNFEDLGLSCVWQPGEAPDPSEAPLLIVLHGRGDSASGFDWLLPRLQIPNLSALLLNAPDPYYTGFSWYDLPPGQQPGILRSRALLTTALDSIWRKGFQPQNVILMGFSQGCLMTLEFGARYPRRLAGYIGISGYAYDEAAILAEAAPAVKSAPWLITHGTRDEVLPVERTRAQMEALQRGDFQLEYREYRKTHTVDPKNELPYIRDWITCHV